VTVKIPDREASCLTVAFMSYVLHVVHGGIGEDGTIQTLLESVGVPYTGSLCNLYSAFVCGQT